MAGSSSIAKFRRAPVKCSPSSKVSVEMNDFRNKNLLEPKLNIFYSSFLTKLTPMPSKQVQNFDLNLPIVKVQSSAVDNLPTLPNDFKAPRIKRGAEPFKAPHCCPRVKSQQRRTSLVLKACHRCHMYIMTRVRNGKCPNCQIRDLKDLPKLLKEAAERDAAAKRIKLDLFLSH